jgi:hypothetical protein
MWLAWIVTEQQADTPIGLIETGTRQRNPRAWLTIGVEAPDYAFAHGLQSVASLADALEWAETCGYSAAPVGDAL